MGWIALYLTQGYLIRFTYSCGRVCSAQAVNGIEAHNICSASVSLLIEGGVLKKIEHGTGKYQFADIKRKSLRSSLTGKVLTDKVKGFLKK